MGWQDLIKLVAPGEPVAARVPNRPIGQLDANVRFLRELFDAAALGKALFSRRVAVEPSARVGQPVYWNAGAQRFERAVAAVASAPGTGALSLADTAVVWGVVKSKSDATTADLLLMGEDDVDLTLSAGGNAAGVYYLSAASPGALSLSRPAVGVPVLKADGRGRVVVFQSGVDVHNSHRHYRFPLVCRPAGTHTPPSVGARHTVSSPDASLPGWLPAGHASFGGLAPRGAAFGYNLAAHPELAAVWPPLPYDSAYLELDRGASASSAGQGVPTGETGLCVVDRNGLWWMSDCYDDVPWPRDLVTPSPDVSMSQGPTPECPRELAFALTLWFTKLDGLADGAAVTRLTTQDRRVLIRRPGSLDPASSGDLQVDLDLNFLLNPTPARGSTVLKSYSNQQFYSGTVAEGLYALDSSVHLTSDLPTVRLDPQDSGSPLVYQGLVGISAVAGPAVELDAQVTQLHGATEEFYSPGGVLYLGMPAGKATRFVSKFRVPDHLPYGSPVFSLKLRLMATSAGTLPALSVKLSRTARPPSGLSSAVTLPPSQSTLAVTTSAAVGSAYGVVEASSTPVSVAPGDTVSVTVSRAASDGYAGAVGVVEQVGYVTEAP